MWYDINDIENQRSLGSKYDYLLATTNSFNDVYAENLTLFEAGITIASPVLGFRPFLCFVSRA